LECAYNEDLLKGLKSYRADIRACKAYVTAVFKLHQLSYQADEETVLRNVEFQKWIERCRGEKIDWKNKRVVRKKVVVEGCKSEKKNPFSRDMKRKLEETGIVLKDTNKFMYEELAIDVVKTKARHFQQIEELKGGEIALGLFASAHVGDCLVTSTLPRKLKKKYGCKVYVVDNRFVKNTFFNNPYVDGYIQEDAEPLGGTEVGLGHHIQRLERFFLLEQDIYPKPEIYLTKEESNWAEGFRKSLPEDKPIIIMCNGARTNNTDDTYNRRPWQLWADIIGEEATVVQLLLIGKSAYTGKLTWQGLAPQEDVLCNHIVLANLPLRLYFAAFSIADGYFGTWASGCHVAAAFDVPSIVHLNDHMKGWPIFPGKERIHQFVYPQHTFARYMPTPEMLKKNFSGVGVEKSEKG